MRIAHTKTLGEIPRLAKNLLPEEAASKAENLRLEAGILSTWAPYEEVQLLTQGIYIKSLYSYDDTWYDWSTDVDFVRSILDQDQYDRVYYTGDRLVPDSILGVSIGPACLIHDHIYRTGETEEERTQADIELFANGFRIIKQASRNKLMSFLRAVILTWYFLAVAYGVEDAYND